MCGLPCIDSAAIRERTALVMPQWFAPEVDAEHAFRIMTANLADVDLYVKPSRLCLVIDHCAAAQEAAETLNERRKTSGLEPYLLIRNAENLGQGESLVRGFQELMDRGCRSDWYVARDADGDHLVNDLPSLARMANQIAALADGCYMVIGRRVNLRRSLGWLRGELEEWINSVLMACLAYRLARREQTIDQRFMYPEGSWPDVQSGYKLYSSELVRQTIAEYARLKEPPWDSDASRFLSQIVPFWLCIEAGGLCGEAIRSSLVALSASSFGPDTFRRQYRTKLHYAITRSELPLAVASRIALDRARHGDLWTSSDGRALVCSICSDLGLTLDSVEWTVS
jgi:hypothetical protein